MARTTISLRASDELVREVITPLKADGRLNHILVNALEGYRSSPTLRRYFDEGIIEEQENVSNRLHDQLNDVMNSIGESVFATERAEQVLNNGKEDLKDTIGASGAPLDTVTRTEFNDLKKMVEGIYSAVVGGELPTVEEDDNEYGYTPEEVVDQNVSEPLIVSTEELDKHLEVSYETSAVEDDEEMIFNYASTEEEEPVKPQGGANLLKGLFDSNSIGGL